MRLDRGELAIDRKRIVGRELALKTRRESPALYVCDGPARHLTIRIRLIGRWRTRSAALSGQRRLADLSVSRVSVLKGLPAWELLTGSRCSG